MLSLILTCLLAFCATLVGMPSLIAVAKRKHLVDEPTETRKIHHRSVPTIGGLMVFAALMSSALVSFAIQQPDSSPPLRVGRHFGGSHVGLLHGA